MHFIFIINVLTFCRYPWGRDAFDKAQSEGKPIFLSGNDMKSQKTGLDFMPLNGVKKPSP